MGLPQRLQWIGFLAALLVAAPLAAAPSPAKALPPAARAAVVGGADAAPGRWPWIARIVTRRGDGGYLCSGTRVAPNAILTAAHCVVDQGTIAAPEDVTVATGRLDAGDEAGGRDWTVHDVLVHPAYDTATLRDDAALLILDGSDAGPLLPLAGAPAAGTTLALAGWGLTAGGTTQPPARLQQTTLTTAPDARCSSAFAGYDPATMLCAGDPAARTGSCNGDSGGPLLVAQGGGWAQVGITSWGARGCDPHAPDVFVRVSAIADWLDARLGVNPPQSAPPQPSAPAPPAARTPAPAAVVYRGRTSQGRAITLTVSGDLRTLALLRARVRGACQRGWSTIGGRGPLAATRAAARLTAAGAFGAAGSTSGGLRYRVSGARSGRRVSGTIRLAAARGCARTAIRFSVGTASRSTSGRRPLPPARQR